MPFTINGHRYTLARAERVYLFGLALFSGALGASVYSAISRYCQAPTVLLHSFCSLDNEIDSGMCPSGYQSFGTTCRQAFYNGTSTLFSSLSSLVGLQEGEPVTNDAVATVIENACIFPIPASQDPQYTCCLTAQVMNCALVLWDSFVAMYKEIQDHHDCIAGAVNGSVTAALMTFLLLGGVMLSVRLYQTREPVERLSEATATYYSTAGARLGSSR